ncbi:MAG TPA: Lrp/AsnC ligand binding domain-containing protein [Candidatus Nanoarchaeia archaeon]|nr:Lrp/AsnC ligand binding domain-containing protein [Candidatus Nanoarchaeia archaeon]
MMITKKDILVLSELRKNARESLMSLARKTNIPVSTIFDKLRDYEGSIIKKHVTLVNFGELGFNTRANILLKVPRDKRALLADFLQKHNNVNSAFKISNGYDFYVECMFRTLKEMEEFNETIEDKFEVRDSKVYFLIEDIKRETFLEDPYVLGLV